MDAGGAGGAGGLGRSLRRLRAVRGLRGPGTSRARAVLPSRQAGGEGLRARVPGPVLGAEPGPGGGLVRCARSVLRVEVTSGGSVFLGWDGAGPGPSAALVAGCPAVDGRATLEPDTDGGWRVVAQRVLVTVSRDGTVVVRTPGGVLLRRDLPPRWWESEPGAGGAWVQRAEVAADARFLAVDGAPLPDGTYAVPGSASPGVRASGSGVVVPVQLVVAEAGTHLVFHDGGGGGRVSLRAGAWGGGSGHDRAGRCELRMAGGPLRYWVLPGPRERALREWATLTGAPVDPDAGGPGGPGR
ncbi:hypothetical protein V1J52_03730 [Streptomyces sp. TRM 70351]|uniref:hypothetical protein n=1 Tax=Streptomyces sp. TRM 70351 TaxID=3116552 RepID=UPI002E7AC620|nr:hypothetical protein [Streptomyces sp. TRM 70351]MEE1927298.1 hypothetical protein [Streptomyces sp. TRM 70351]